MPYLIEGEVSDFKDVMKSIVNGLSNLSKKKSSNFLNKSSISRASKDLVLSFPVLCSNTIDPKTASMISKAVERNSVAMLQLLLTSAYLKGENGQEVLQQWHNNLDKDLSIDEYIDLADNFASTISKESAEDLSNLAIRLQNTFLNESGEFFPVSSFRESSILDYTVNTRYGGLNVAKRRFIMEESELDDYLHVNKDNRDAQEQINNTIDRRNSYHNDKSRLENDDKKYAYTQAHDKDVFNQNADKNQFEKDKFAAQQKNNKLDSDFAYFQKNLLDSDVKKCNELIPSMMVVRYTPTDGDNGAADVQQFVAGVKARLVACDSADIVDRVRVVNKDKVNLVNLVRATTGEISFCKDFVAAINQAKIDAKGNSNLSKTNPIWRALQTRAGKSTYNRLRRAKANDAGAITTLVVSQEEVNYLNKEYDIDLANPAKARFIMESYNLIALVIVDEQVEVVRFLYDGEKFFQDYSFSSLERETGDGSYKKVINLISKINRG